MTATPNETAGAAELGNRLRSYLQDADRRRALAVARALGAMEPRERTLVREAAVMGYVQGARASHEPISRDSAIVDTVVAACIHTSDLYPTTAGLSANVSPQSPSEKVAAAVVEHHTPRCATCGAEWSTCPCDIRALVCSTCGADAMPTPFPCATVQVFGRPAGCENLWFDDDMNERRCDGLLLFTPGAPQARCMTCGAWCGALAANYLDQAARAVRARPAQAP